MNQKNNRLKKVLICSSILFHSSLSACCGCALVSAGMNGLKSASQSGFEALDMALANIINLENSAILGVASEFSDDSEKNRLLSAHAVKIADDILFQSQQNGEFIDVINSIEIQKK